MTCSSVFRGLIYWEESSRRNSFGDEMWHMQTERCSAGYTRKWHFLLQSAEKKIKSSGVNEVIVYCGVISACQLFRVDKRKSSKSILCTTYSNFTAL